jgi:hypothetical protein
MNTRLFVLMVVLLAACYQAHAAMYLTLANGKHCVLDGPPTAEYPYVCTDAEYKSAFAPPNPNDSKTYALMIAGYVHSPIEKGAVISRTITPLLFDQAMSAIMSAQAGPCMWVTGMTYDRATRTINIRCDRATHAYHVEVSDGAWLVSVLK